MMFERHVLDYLIYLVGKGRAQETVRSRKSPLAMFGKYLSRNGIRDVTEVSVRKRITFTVYRTDLGLMV